MSRNLSAATKRALFASETSEVFLLLLTIGHADLPQPLRFSSDAVNTASRAMEFIAFPFELNLPDDRDDQISRASIRIDNVDREIVRTIRSIATAPTVTLEIVLASSPDTVEAGPFEFILSNVSWDALVVEGDLGYEEDILNQRFPAHTMTPQNFPGLFA